MDNEAQILLDDIISFCQRDGLDTRLINMLGQSIPVSLDDESLTLQVPSRFASTYLLKQQETIECYLEEITFAPMALRVEVPAMPAPAQVQPPVPQASAQAAYSPAAGERIFKISRKPQLHSASERVFRYTDAASDQPRRRTHKRQGQQHDDARDVSPHDEQYETAGDGTGCFT